MTTKPEFDKLLEELQSDDLMVLIPALDNSVAPLREFAARVVKHIEDPGFGVFVAERLTGLLITVLREVEKFHATTTDTEAKAYSAVVLLQLGSKQGVPALLEAVETSHMAADFAARKLAYAKVTEVYEHIINRIRKRDISNPRVIVSLLAILRDFQIELPPDLASELLADDTPDEVREFISTAWPQPAALFSAEPSSNAWRV